MPRRTKRYIGPGKTLVNGGRWEFVEEAEGRPLYDVTDCVPVDFAKIRREVEIHVEKFQEFALLPDRERFIDDLAHECAFVSTLRLDYLVEGRRTKPDEWTKEILVVGAGAVLQRHGLDATISEYERGFEKVQSLYLRLIAGLIKLAGFSAPKDIKGLCLRAKANITVAGSHCIDVTSPPQTWALYFPHLAGIGHAQEPAPDVSVIVRRYLR